VVLFHPVVQFDVRLRSLLTLRGATTKLQSVVVLFHPVVQFDVRLRSLLILRGATTKRAVVSHVDFRLILPPQYEFQTIESLVHGQKRQQAPKLAPSGSGQYSLKQDAILIVSDPHVFCSLQLCSELPD